MLLDNPRSAEGLHLLNEGRFRKQRRGDYVTCTERIDDDGLMHNIFVFERQSSVSGEVFTATFAESGEIVIEEDSGRRYLELRGGSRYQGEPGALALDEITFSLYGELIPESQNSLRRIGKVDAIATEVLWDSEDPRLQGALWWRISLPLMVPAIAIIALALSRTDARRGRYAKIGPAMVILLLYFLGLTQGRGAIEDAEGPALMIGIHVGFALLAVVLYSGSEFPSDGKGVAVSKFDWYVGKPVLVATLGVLTLLVGLDALTSVVDETDDIRDGYGFTDILIYVGYTIPRRIHEFVPFAALIGALIGLGQLAATSELVVMRAAGVSMFRMAICPKACTHCCLNGLRCGGIRGTSYRAVSNELSRVGAAL